MTSDDILKALAVLRQAPQTQQDIHQLATLAQDPSFQKQIDQAAKDARMFAYTNLAIAAASLGVSFAILMVFLRRERREVANNRGKE